MLTGLHIHDPVTGAWPKKILPCYRALEAATLWFSLETSQGVWDFSWMDQVASKVHRHGSSMLLVLGGTPTWASARPAETSIWQVDGASSEPADIANWTNYVRTVIRRYSRVIDAVEIWNECSFTNDGTFFSGSYAALVALAEIVWDEVKAFNPRVKVCSPSMIDYSSRDILRGYLSAGGDSFCDVISWHLYTPTADEIPVNVSEVRDVFSEYSLSGLPFWCTEFGLKTTAAEAHNRLAALQSSGVQRAYWYAYDEQTNGLDGTAAEAIWRQAASTRIGLSDII